MKEPQLPNSFNCVELMLRTLRMTFAFKVDSYRESVRQSGSINVSVVPSNSPLSSPEVWLSF